MYCSCSCLMVLSLWVCVTLSCWNSFWCCLNRFWMETSRILCSPKGCDNPTYLKLFLCLLNLLHVRLPLEEYWYHLLLVFFAQLVPANEPHPQHQVQRIGLLHATSIYITKLHSEHFTLMLIHNPNHAWMHWMLQVSCLINMEHRWITQDFSPSITNPYQEPTLFLSQPPMQ